MIDLDLLHAPVDADPMVLMDDVVADLELREGPDLLPVVLLAGGLLFLLRAEDIGFRDHRGLYIGILKSLPDPAVTGHDLAGDQLSVRILAVEGRDPVRREVPGESSGPGPGGGDQRDPVTLLAV